MSKHLKAQGQNKKLRNRILIISITLAVITAALLGTWLFIQYRNDQKTVEVMPVSYLSTSYWGDQATSSGTILSDYVQEIFPTSDKVISEVFVTEGQEVHIGDPLLQYDKTKLELDVESKDLAVKQSELKIDEAQKQLKKLQNTKPASTAKPVATPRPTQRPTAKPTPVPTPTPGPTPIPPADVTLYSRLDETSLPYSGSGTSDDPYVFLCTDGCVMTKEFLMLLLGAGQDDGPEPGSSPEPGEDGPSSEAPEDTPSEAEPAGNGLASPFAALFEVREGDSNYGNVISSFKLDGTQLSASIKTVALWEDSTMDDVQEAFLDATPTPTPTPNPNNYDDMGYTSAQLKEMIEEKKTEIRDLQYALKQAKLNLEIAQRALDNSTVLSNVDGRVRTLIDLELAVAEGKPFMVVSGDDKYYISGALNEGLLGSVNVGDTVQAMSWMNGMSYSAQIVSISDFPMDSSSGYGYYGAGNPNSSSYEFTAVIEDGDDTLENGMGVEITMNVQEAGDGGALYLERPYLREDDAGFYIMKAGHDNRLYKQYVQTGKTIYGGSYLEIKSGLTAEDFIAFPYGADTKEGVRVALQESGDPPYPEEGSASGSGLESGSSLGEGASDLLDGESSGLDEDNGTEEPGVMEPNLPAGAVITGRDENGTYFETEDGGGVILD